MCSKIEGNIIEAITMNVVNIRSPAPPLKIGVVYLGILHKVHWRVVLLIRLLITL